jgi:DNA-binding transcriptional ArsR family regulator
MQADGTTKPAASGMIDASTTPGCAVMEGLPKEALEQVAAYFQALSEPMRLTLLNLLRAGERNVGELAQLAGTTSANVSRHLALLSQHGLVAREGRGTSVYYRIADPSVYQLCDLVCGSLARKLERAAVDRTLFSGGAAPARAVGRRRPG